MLTISLDRIFDLLEKATEIDIDVLLEHEDAAALADGAEEEAMIDEALGDDPAYQEFLSALGALTDAETHELLALGLLGRNDASFIEWPALVEQARLFRQEEILDELVRTLLLTDDIETALDRLDMATANESDDEGSPEEDAED